MKSEELNSRRRSFTRWLLIIVLVLGVLVLMRGGIIKIPIPLLGTVEIVHDKNNDMSQVLLIKDLPRDLQGSPDIVLPKIWALWEEKNKLESDIQYSFWFIDREISTNVTINTNRTILNEYDRELNKHIQKCLTAIGSYGGNISSDAGLTSSAIKQFQSSKHIKVDGIIGRDTWREIVGEFERKKSQ